MEPRQIGWSQESILLWGVSRELERLGGLVAGGLGAVNSLTTLGNAGPAILEDGVLNIPVYTSGAGSPGLTSASNGLSIVPAGNVILGGPLTGNTTISVGAFLLALTGNTPTSVLRVTNSSATIGSHGIQGVSGGANSYGVSGVNTGSGTGIYAESNTGAAISAVSQQGQILLTGTVTPIDNSSTCPMIRLFRDSQAQPVIGIGVGIEYYIKTDTSAVLLSNKLVSRWTNVGTSTRTSEFIVQGVFNGGTRDLFNLSGEGLARLNQYGASQPPGATTPVFALNIDNAGRIVQVPIPVTNLSYIPSPVNGTVVSSSGDDATLPLVDAANAGLLSPVDYLRLQPFNDANYIRTTGATAQTRQAPITFEDNVFMPNIVTDTTPTVAPVGIGTLSRRLVQLPIDENLELIVTNRTGVLIPKGSVVYIDGASGSKPTVALALADPNIASSLAIGVVVDDIPINGTEGRVVTNGIVERQNTSAFPEGAKVFLSPTVPGGLTTTIPTSPNNVIFVGTIVAQHGVQGRILISVAYTFKLDRLIDVNILNPINDEVLAYDSTVGFWKNKSLTLIGAALDTNVVHRTGNLVETISGTKTFSSTVVAPGYSIPNPPVDTVLLATGGTAKFADIISGGQTELLTWKFLTATTATDPGANQFKMNNITPSLVTQLYVNDITNILGADISALFAKIKGDWFIHIQATGDATKYMQFTSATAYTDNGVWWTLPVTWVQGAGFPINNAAATTWVMINQNSGGAPNTLLALTDYNLPASSSLQKAFNAPDDSVILAPGIYKISWLFGVRNLSNANTNISLGFLGTAAVATNSIKFSCNSRKSNNPDIPTIDSGQSFQQGLLNNVFSITEFNNRSKAAFALEGIIRIITPGTLIPAVSSSAFSTGTAMVEDRQLFQITKIQI